jgi:hypothetical protein
LEFFTQGSFHAAGPALQALLAQTTQLFGQERFHLIGFFGRSPRTGADLQNVLEAFQQFRMLAQSVDQGQFSGTEFAPVWMCVFHPHCK